MLNSETKNKIKALRDTLVGKIPDPKGQIEQITNALIYKFMDDQDKQSQALGGKPSFFVEDLAQYAWHKLFDSKLSNTDKAQLYRQGIEVLREAKHLPPLFQDIFKDADLPFRADGTIALFLNGINGFSYDNSEELGNAFEYLLADMSSQGNAGQFRTPRHIIDFMVQVVSPQKSDSIFDPACGTAGFLIEAYKYIRKENKNLSSKDLIDLSKNISGVDIDPTMAKLAKVNLYLHGFKTPNIDESDTLTNENFWKKQKYDCILANPPFMTPRGGIKPHEHFSVQANRSEVLFVDYIAEHLRLQGKAGVIVPEGIIFQAATAYKKLRKLLVEDWGLYAVVSLPSGVFQPYSGVKTSVLLLDRSFESDEILFVKIENDGFDLGAQRREIDKNDLPQALHILQEWKKNQTIKDDNKPLAHSVPKTKIAKNEEYNLTGDRYKENINYENVKYNMVKIGDIFESGRGRVISKKDIEKNKGIYPVFSSQTTNNGILGKIKTYDFEGEYLTWTTDGANAGKVFYRSGKFNCTNVCGTLKLKQQFIKKANLKYIAPILDAVTENFVIKVGNPKLMNKEIEKIKIPLPPLEVQEQIVAEIEQWQKVIDGAKQVIETYKPSFAINPDWEMVELGEVCEEIKSGFAFGKSSKDNSGIPHIRPMNISINREYVLDDIKYIPLSELKNKQEYLLKKGDVLFNNTNSKELVGKNCFIDKSTNALFSNHITRIRTKKTLISHFLSIVLYKKWEQNYFFNLCNKWVGQAGVNNDKLSKIKIPLPPLEVQEQIVVEIEAEQKAVESCKTLKATMEQKITDKIAKVWE